MKVCPSIASCDVMKLGITASVLEEKYNHIHVDIEDGNYINNITFGMKVLRGICNTVKCEVSVHLMVTNPLQYLEEISQMKHIGIVFFHPDCTRYPSQIINAYLEKNIKVGLAFNPATSIEEYQYTFEDKIKDVLVMTCEPDMRGQIFISKMKNKLNNCSKYGVKLWADGAITDDIKKDLAEMGVDNVVMGRTVYDKM